MAFLALASQKSLLMLQKNFLLLQYTSISNQNQQALAKMSAIERNYAAMGDDAPDYTEDPDFIYFEELSNQLETEKDSIDSQMTAIEAEISGLKTLVNNNIKSSCTLNITGGG